MHPRQRLLQHGIDYHNESRQRRQARALLEQKAKRESINTPAADKNIALQNMLRVHGEGASIHHISKIDGCPATLVDPGAQVSACSVSKPVWPKDDQ
jgi:hypothetical protein